MASSRFTVFVGLLFGGSMLAGVANAQSPLAAAPPIRTIVDEHGVNIVTGLYNRSDPLISVGTPGSGGLSATRNIVEGAARDSYVGTINSGPSGGYLVSVGSSTEAFDSKFANLSGSASTFSYNSSNFSGVYTTSDGTVYNFVRPAPAQYQTPYQGSLGLLGSIKHADGQVDTYTYDNEQVCSGTQQVASPQTEPDASLSSKAQQCSFISRLQSIISNTRFELDFNYGNNGLLLTSISSPQGGTVALNNGSISNGSTVLRYTFDAQTAKVTGAMLGTTSPITTTAAFDSNGRIATWSDGVSTYNYTYSDDSAGIRTTTVAGPTGNKSYFSNIANARLVRYTDEKGRITAYTYDSSFAHLTNVQRQEGDQT